MAIDFPTAPTTGQQYAFGGVTYTFTSQGVWAPTSSSAVPATPFDALAYNGLQINGSMDVSQEKGTAQTTANTGYVLDGWRMYFSGTMALTAGTGAPSGVNGVPNVLYVLTSTAQTSIGNGYAFVANFIEGYRIARLAWGTASAQPITIGFWTAHNRTGVYSVSLRGGSGRSYVATYTQSVANGPQYNVITIPGDTGGVWAIDNTIGFYISFTFAAGGTALAPSANTWLAGDYIGAAGQVNAVAATSDVFRITGLVVLPGIELPSAARSPLIMRPYDQELPICMRYYQKLENVVVDAPAVFQTYILSIPMRSVPTITGGGVGFNVSINDGIIINVYQTTRSFQTLVFDARL